MQIHANNTNCICRSFAFLKKKVHPCTRSFVSFLLAIERPTRALHAQVNTQVSGQGVTDDSHR